MLYIFIWTDDFLNCFVDSPPTSTFKAIIAAAAFLLCACHAIYAKQHFLCLHCLLNLLHTNVWIWAQFEKENLAETNEVNFKTLPQLFKANGYHTIGLGKIGHYVDGLVYTYAGEGDGQLEMPGSWDEIWGPKDKWGTAWNAFFGYADGSNRNTKKKEVSPMEFTAEKDADLPDGIIADRAAKTVLDLKEN